jgi:DnaJ family protein C protein 13
MALSETCIVERDPATYQVVTVKPLCEVFALVRYSDDPQRFTIEFSSGRVKRYSATDRYVPTSWYTIVSA